MNSEQNAITELHLSGKCVPANVDHCNCAEKYKTAGQTDSKTHKVASETVTEKVTEKNDKQTIAKTYTVSAGALVETVKAYTYEGAAVAFGVTHVFHGNVSAWFLATQNGIDLYRITSNTTGASVVVQVEWSVEA